MVYGEVEPVSASYAHVLQALSFQQIAPCKRGTGGVSFSASVFPARWISESPWRVKDAITSLLVKEHFDNCK